MLLHVSILQLQMKVNEFINNNNILSLNKDPTEKYQKLIQQAIKKANSIIDKNVHKYLMNIKPTAPKLTVQLKTHKVNQPIRPVINNTPAPAYRTAKYINKKLQRLIQLPNTYNTVNSQDIATELTTLKITDKMKMITPDITDMYVNLPIDGIIKTTKFWLNRNSSNTEQTKQQTLNVITTLIEQNYFQYNDKLYQPTKDITMGHGN